MGLNSKQILHNNEYRAISVTVDATTEGTVTEGGRKYLPAGSMIAGVGSSIFKDRKVKVKVATPATADAILKNDVELTDGDTPGAGVYEGTVRSDRVIDYTNALDAKLPRIQFVEGV